MNKLTHRARIASSGCAVAAWRRQPLSRRRLLQATGATAIAAGLGARSLVVPATAQENVGGVLTILCWQGYDGPNANKPFVEQTGTEINAIYLGSNDEIFANLRAGGLGEIDLVTPYHGYVKNLYEADLLQEIDYSRLPNTADYIPIFQKPEWNTFDGKTYAAPFVWGTGPMIYNAEFIPEAPAEWMDVMKPEYTGKVVMTDDALGHYLIWNQVTGADDPTQVTQEQLDKTTDLLIQIKTEQARAFSPNMGDMADILARGEAWLSTIGWEAVPAFPVPPKARTSATPTPRRAISPSSIPTASRRTRRISTPPTPSSSTCSAPRRRRSRWTTWTARRSTRRRSRCSTRRRGRSSPMTISMRSSRSRRSGASRRSRIRATAS